MTDNNYNTDYTQALPRGLVVIKGYLKTSVKTEKVNIYQMVPDSPSQSFLSVSTGNLLNQCSLNTYFIKTEKSLFYQPNIHMCTDWRGITYDYVLSVLDKDTINVVLLDSVSLDNTFGTYLGNMSFRDMLVLSAHDKENKYTEHYNNIVGFVFRGRPDVSLPYFVNMVGSKHMVIKHLYRLNFNIVNMAFLAHCCVYETFENEDAGSYVNLPGFSFTVTCPQSKDEPALILDDSDIFVDREDTIPETVPPMYLIQTNIDEILPFVTRLSLVELEHNLARRSASCINGKHAEAIALIEEDRLRKQQELVSKNEEEIQKFTLWKESEVLLQENKLIKYKEARELQIKEKLSEYYDTETVKLRARMLSEVEQEGIRLSAEKTREIGESSNRIIQSVNDNYAAMLVVKQKELAEYERSERARIESELAKVHSERKAVIDGMQTITKAELEKEFIKNKSASILEELRTEAIVKCNKEYEAALLDMNAYVQKNRANLENILSVEHSNKRLLKMDEFKRWIEMEKVNAEGELKQHIASQKAHYSDMAEKYYHENIETLKLAIEHEHTIALGINLNKINQEILARRLEENCKLDADMARMRNTAVKELESQNEISRMTMFSELKSECELEKKRFETSIQQELIAFKNSEMERIDKEKTQELLLLHNQKVSNLDLEYIDKHSAMLLEIRHLKEQREADLVKDIEQRMEAAYSGIEHTVETVLAERKLAISDQLKLFEKELEKEHAASQLEKIEKGRICVETEIEKIRVLAKERFNTEQAKYEEITRESLRYEMQQKTTNLEAEHSARMSQLQREFDEMKKSNASALRLDKIEMEQKNIAFFNSERERLMTSCIKDIGALKEKEMAKLLKEMAEEREVQAKKVKSELVPLKERLVKDLELRIESELAPMRKNKETELEQIAAENALEYMKTLKQSLTEKLESEIATEKERILKKSSRQIEDELEIFRIARIEELTKVVEKQVDSELESIRTRKFEELEILAQEHIVEYANKTKGELKEKLEAQILSEKMQLTQKAKEEIDKELELYRKDKLAEANREFLLVKQKLIDDYTEKEESERQSRKRELQSLLSKLTTK
jgi:hypothetical protein